MSVYRRQDTGGWIVDVKVGSNRVRRTLGPKALKREAEALERQIRAEIEAGRPRERDPVLWHELAARYWEEHAQRLKWAKDVKAHLNALSDTFGDDRPVSTITPSLIAEAVAVWSNGGASPYVVNNRLAVGSGIWTRARDVWAVDLPHVPWRRLRVVEPDPVPTYIPPEEREAVLAHCAPHVRHAGLIALATGLRRASVLSLQWEDVHFDRGVIVARGKSVKPGGKALLLPLTDELREIFNEIGPQDCGPVITWRGRQVADIKTSFSKARRKAGLPHVRFKDFRHSVALEILEATGSLDLAGATLGHSDPRVTQRHYARFQVDAIREGLQKRRDRRYG